MDPYDDLEPEYGEVNFPSHTPSDEEKLYYELIGKYQGALGESGTTTENVLWESVNTVLKLLINKGYEHYSRFIIQPTQLGPRDFIQFGTFRSQLMSALQRMSQDFGFSDPSYLIHKDIPKSGHHINASAIASPVQENHQNINQNQSQTQHQESQLTIDQRISLIEKELEENLTDEQLAEVKPIFEEYKAEPTKWNKASKFIKVLLNLSKDISIGIISNIIASQMGIPKN